MLRTFFIYQLTRLCFELTLPVLKPFAQASSASQYIRCSHMLRCTSVLYSASLCVLQLLLPSRPGVWACLTYPLLEKGCRVPCVLVAVGVSGSGIYANFGVDPCLTS